MTSNKEDNALLNKLINLKSASKKFGFSKMSF